MMSRMMRMVVTPTMFIFILILSVKSFIRSKPPGRRLVTSDIHLLQVNKTDYNKIN